MTQAAANSKEMPDDFRASITNAPGAKSYPISSFTWLLIPSEIKDPAKKQAITGFLKWMMTDGQKDCQALSYAPLPKAVVAKEQKQISMIKESPMAPRPLQFREIHPFRSASSARTRCLRFNPALRAWHYAATVLLV